MKIISVIDPTGGYFRLLSVQPVQARFNRGSTAVLKRNIRLASIRDKSGYFGPVPAVGLEPKQNLGMKINSVSSEPIRFVAVSIR